MADRYAPKEFEQKWRDRWKAADLFRTREDPDRPKFYGLDFFPYPSGAGLSVGHCRNYIPTDVVCRMKYMQGYNVLHPMGFDAFGLPAENEAIKNRTHPAPMVDQYAATYRRQMELVGIGYDWSRCFKSSDPTYYRWTQWIFKLLYERGLAYRKNAAVNWCPTDKTVLADEEVVGGLCWRCDTPVEKKFIPQWFFKITDYAQRLIDDLDELEWPEGIKQMQRNWIGRSEGVEFEMALSLPERPPADPSAMAEELLAHVPEHIERAREAAELLAQAREMAPEAHRSELDSLIETSKELAARLEGLASADQARAQATEFQRLADQLEDRTEDLQEAWEDESARKLLTGAEDLFDAVEDAFEELMDAEADSAKADFERTDASPPKFRVFTTRIDTIFGMTFCVLAPEHPLVEVILRHVDEEHAEEVEAYREGARRLSDQDRQAVGREKTGVFTGAYAINPANGQKVPVYVADYVLMGYGTGAIMAVPGHDARDFEFAQKYGIPIPQVISPTPDGAEVPLPFESKDGWLVNSGEYSGMSVAESQSKLGEWMEALGIGERKVNYKLRDWLISRQRYWGCPIPIIHTAGGELQAVPDELLPVTLPDVENYEPSGDGSSPLERIEEFVNVTDLDGRLGRRETDTMGGFACSSWYFLRFADPHNNESAWDQEKVSYWLPVDCYVGGAEHAVMHLLYARFWTKVLYDAGYVPFKEPFRRLINQGTVLAQTPFRKPREGEQVEVGEEGIQISFADVPSLPADQVFYRWTKMSKSKGNVVTPDEAVDKYGADALRVFELFVAPFEMNIQWSDEGVQGAVRFLSRVFKFVSDLGACYEREWKARIAGVSDPEAVAVRRLTHQTILKTQSDIEAFAFNTYISALMVYLNGLTDAVKQAGSSPGEDMRLALSEAVETFVLLIAPAAPHSADELWEALGHEGFTFNASWPQGDPELAKADRLTIAVQVNGKLRDTMELPASSTQKEMEAAALALDKVKAHTDGKTVRRVIVVPGKLVNVVAN